MKTKQTYSGPTLYQDVDGIRCSWECLSDAAKIRVARFMVAGERKRLANTMPYTFLERARDCRAWRKVLYDLETKHGASGAYSSIH